MGKDGKGHICFRMDYDTVNVTVNGSWGVNMTNDPDYSKCPTKGQKTFVFAAETTLSNKERATLTFNFTNTSSGIQLASLTVKVKDNKESLNVTGNYNLQHGENTSYACNTTFTYTAINNTKTSLVMKDVQVQAFIPAGQTGFSQPSDAWCPGAAKKRSKKVGLIVGAVLTGLALFGIVGFAFSRCRSRT